MFNFYLIYLKKDYIRTMVVYNITFGEETHTLFQFGKGTPKKRFENTDLGLSLLLINHHEFANKKCDINRSKKSQDHLTVRAFKNETK